MSIYEIEETAREIKARKSNYWRGFRSGVIVCIPFFIALLWGLNIALEAMTK